MSRKVQYSARYYFLSLSMILLNVYISTPFLFADNVKLLSIRANDANDPQEDTDNLTVWATQNNMKFGETKCKSLTIRRDKITQTVENVKIIQVDGAYRQ